jgi:hypothetical protein
LQRGFAVEQFKVEHGFVQAEMARGFDLFDCVGKTIADITGIEPQGVTVGRRSQRRIAGARENQPRAQICRRGDAR